jgi:signal transduction histidine kinase
VARREQSWVISTTDGGRSVEASELPRLFSLFDRPGEPEADATGLAIARRTVEQHGGVIWLAPAPGRGTTVSFTLPADEPGVGAPAVDDARGVAG